MYRPNLNIIRRLSSKRVLLHPLVQITSCLSNVAVGGESCGYAIGDSSNARRFGPNVTLRLRHGQYDSLHNTADHPNHAAVGGLQCRVM